MDKVAKMLETGVNIDTTTRTRLVSRGGEDSPHVYVYGCLFPRKCTGKEGGICGLNPNARTRWHSCRTRSVRTVEWVFSGVHARVCTIPFQHQEYTQTNTMMGIDYTMMGIDYCFQCVQNYHFSWKAGNGKVWKSDIFIQLFAETLRSQVPSQFPQLKVALDSFESKVNEFDSDNDGVLDDSELDQFIKAIGSSQESNYYKYDAPEADASYLEGDRMTTAGLRSFYEKAAGTRLEDVIANLNALQVPTQDLQVPARADCACACVCA